MNHQELFDLLVEELIPRLEKHDGLSVFAKRRAKFEAWLKVEIVNILCKRFKDVIPEQNTIDICFEDWALELKTINTNYDYQGVTRKGKPISTNRDGVIADIAKLRGKNIFNRGVVFIVFPAKADNRFWIKHHAMIESHVEMLLSHPFHFIGNVPAILYFGHI